MKKVKSGFIDRLNNGEPFWIALPSSVIRQMAIGILIDAVTIGGVAELNQKERKIHDKKYSGVSKSKTSKTR